MTYFIIAFYLFAFIILGSAYVVVTSKNIIYSAYNLMLTFFGVAGIYAILGADFISIVQVIVYVGGIMVLILFGIMLTNKVNDTEIKTGFFQVLPASIIVGMFSGVLIASVSNNNWIYLNKLAAPVSSLAGIGHILMNEYIVIFEVLGVLLLIALIGAASIARK
jgi:NADH-quinone oxidoreductase subunit J